MDISQYIDDFVKDKNQWTSRKIEISNHLRDLILSLNLTLEEVKSIFEMIEYWDSSDVSFESKLGEVLYPLQRLKEQNNTFNNNLTNKELIKCAKLQSQMQYICDDPTWTKPWKHPSKWMSKMMKIMNECIENRVQRRSSS